MLADIYLQTDKECQLFKNNEEMFKYLTKNDYVIKKIEDGEIVVTFKEAKEELKFHFGKIETFDTKLEFVKEITKYKETLKSSLDSLKELGLELTKEQSKVLNDGFTFLQSDKQS